MNMDAAGKAPITALRKKDGTVLLTEEEMGDIAASGRITLQQLADDLIRHPQEIMCAANLFEDRTAEIAYHLRVAYPEYMAERERLALVSRQKDIKLEDLTFGGSPLLTSKEMNDANLHHTTLGHMAHAVVKAPHVLGSLSRARISELKQTLTAEFPELMQSQSTPARKL